jgi:hypothetical protein
MIHQCMNKSISNDDLIKYFEKRFKTYIITFSELASYQTINQLLPKPKDFKIILIE